MKEFESNPGKIKSANESSGADGTARRTAVTGGGGTDMNMKGELKDSGDMNDNAPIAVQAFDIDSIIKPASDSMDTVLKSAKGTYLRNYTLALLLQRVVASTRY